MTRLENNPLTWVKWIHSFLSGPLNWFLKPKQYSVYSTELSKTQERSELLGSVLRTCQFERFKYIFQFELGSYAAYKT